ncbi:MAG: hypothetical protein WC678_03985 [Parcubacteria group bacterium]|jgi:hypothetical protein
MNYESQNKPDSSKNQEQQKIMKDLLDGHRSLVKSFPQWAESQASYLNSEREIDDGTKKVAEAVQIVLNENPNIGESQKKNLQEAIDRVLGKSNNPESFTENSESNEAGEEEIAKVEKEATVAGEVVVGDQGKKIDQIAKDINESGIDSEVIKSGTEDLKAISDQTANISKKFGLDLIEENALEAIMKKIKDLSGESNFKTDGDIINDSLRDYSILSSGEMLSGSDSDIAVYEETGALRTTTEDVAEFYSTLEKSKGKVLKGLDIMKDADEINHSEIFTSEFNDLLNRIKQIYPYEYIPKEILDPGNHDYKNKTIWENLRDKNNRKKLLDILPDFIEKAFKYREESYLNALEKYNNKKIKKNNNNQ